MSLACPRLTVLVACCLSAPLTFAPAFGAEGAARCGARVDAGAALAQAQRSAEQGDSEAAISCYRRALTALPGRDLTGHVDARLGLARLLDERGAFEEASTQLKRALAEAEAAPGPDPERTAEVVNWLGWVEFELGRYSDAERDLRHAQSIYEGMPEPPGLKMTYVLAELGNVYREQRDYDRAESVLAQALAILDRPGADDRSRRAAIYNNLAGVAYYRGDYPRAIELYRNTYALLEALYGESRVEV